jgi:hypothetical protein
MDEGKPPQRVGFTDRQFGDEHAAHLPGTARGSRDGRAQDQPGDMLATGDQHLAQAAGDRGQQQVVHRHPERVAGALHVLERLPDDGQPPLRPDLSRQRGDGCAGAEVGHHVLEP